MPLPRNPDGTLNWQRIKFQDKEFWHLSDEEWRARTLTEADEKKAAEEAKAQPPQQLSMILDEIKHSNHPEGFDGDEI